MIKAKGLHPRKYRAGSWSKANMKWTRAEDWAAWERAKAEDKQRSLCEDREGIDKRGSTDNELERTDSQGSVNDGRERIDQGWDVQMVSEDACA